MMFARSLGITKWARVPNFDRTTAQPSSPASVAHVDFASKLKQANPRSIAAGRRTDVTVLGGPLCV